MLKIDKAILDTDGIICKNISKFDFTERGLLSQNILSQLRNYVEYIATKIYGSLQNLDIDPNDYKMKENSIKYVKTRGELRFLYNFHELLQKSASHYSLNEDASERLLLKYYEFLIKIKVFLKNKYNLSVLDNIKDFPINTDTELISYYEKIAEKINQPSENCCKIEYSDRYYIQKIKPFFIDYNIYYEITFTTANNKTSKFDRVIAFTNQDLIDNYSVKFTIHKDSINILEKNMDILIIDSWFVSIRPCELDNFADIIGEHTKINAGTKEYAELMQLITHTRMPLSEFVVSDESYYRMQKENILRNSKNKNIFDILDTCRNIIINNQEGSNILKYLLHRLNNNIIKAQRANQSCSKLSNLYLKYQCIPFEKMPFCTSLSEHNPLIKDLMECFYTKDREHELFARYIKNNAEINGHLFTSIRDINGFDDIDKLIYQYNSSLYYKHTHRQLIKFRNHVYIKGYGDNCNYIIKRLQDLSTSGLSQYTASVDSWLSKSAYYIDSEEKRNVLRTMFATSHVALIYGAAGTGKSTLVNHIANFFNNYKKIFLANTHPAKDNLRNKVTADKSEFFTIAKFNSKYNTNIECDVLVIDECSTVSNSDMQAILEKAKFKILILVGDIYQIESIYFGNWFDIAKNFIADNSIFELTNPYRTTDENLRLLWDRVRKLDNAILETSVKNEYSKRLDETILQRTDDDEIVLCLNYDGLYGINNINRFIQNSNPNPPIQWGINSYKIGDRILFNETNRFVPLIHNNSKGRIVNIDPQEKRIIFDIELDFAINSLDAFGYDFELIGTSGANNSIIRFSVNKYRSTDEDYDNSDTIVPFQVSYAISIHKAQGLEYDSVKIVITNEVEERITHNIFYTAITRAKKKLNIYWSPETENYILKQLSLRNSKKDAILLRGLYSM